MRVNYSLPFSNCFASISKLCWGYSSAIGAGLTDDCLSIRIGVSPMGDIFILFREF